MAINKNDVKLFESQRLTDEEDGGGRITGRKVIDGASIISFRIFPGSIVPWVTCPCARRLSGSAPTIQREELAMLEALVTVPASIPLVTCLSFSVLNDIDRLLTMDTDNLNYSQKTQKVRDISDQHH